MHEHDRDPANLGQDISSLAQWKTTKYSTTSFALPPTGWHMVFSVREFCPLVAYD